MSLPDPQELYNQGEWNWDKFMELAKQATKDTDNDGKIDVYGFSGWPIDVLRHFTAANGGTIVDDENAKEGLSDPKTIEAAEFVKRLYNVENVVKVKTGIKPTGRKAIHSRMETLPYSLPLNGSWAISPLPLV